MCVDMPTDVRQACLTYRWEALVETGSNGYRLVYTAVLDVPKPHEHPGGKKTSPTFVQACRDLAGIGARVRRHDGRSWIYK